MLLGLHGNSWEVYTQGNSSEEKKSTGRALSFSTIGLNLVLFNITSLLQNQIQDGYTMSCSLGKKAGSLQQEIPQWVKEGEMGKKK